MCGQADRLASVSSAPPMNALPNGPHAIGVAGTLAVLATSVPLVSVLRSRNARAARCVASWRP